MQAVRRGEEVLLTERGRPIAVIKPIARGEPEDDAAALRDLIDARRNSYPGGQSMLRPASRCRWMWNTVWPPPRLQLNTVR